MLTNQAIRLLDILKRDEELKSEIDKKANYEHLLRYLRCKNTDNNYIAKDGSFWEEKLYQGKIILQFNLKKPLLEQSDEVLSALCDYLDNLK